MQIYKAKTLWSIKQVKINKRKKMWEIENYGEFVLQIKKKKWFQWLVSPISMEWWWWWCSMHDVSSSFTSVTILLLSSFSTFIVNSIVKFKINYHKIKKEFISQKKKNLERICSVLAFLLSTHNWMCKQSKTDYKHFNLPI